MDSRSMQMVFERTSGKGNYEIDGEYQSEDCEAKRTTTVVFAITTKASFH
jgi:hypothetical protein